MNKHHLIFVSALFLFACGKQESTPPVVARVGSSFLSLKDARAALADPAVTEAYLENVVVRWVERELLYRAALSSGYDKDLSILSAVSNYKKLMLGKAYLMSTSKLNIQIQPAEIEAYYEKNITSYVRSADEAVVFHFLVSSIKEANNIFSRLKKSGTGAGLEMLLKEYNVKAETLTRSRVFPKIGEKVFSKNNHTLIAPFKSGLGFHVIKVLNKNKAGTPRGFLEVYDEIQQRLLQSKALVSSNRILDSLKYEYQAEIYLEGAP